VPETRVRRFRLKFFFASKRNEAKQDPFRFVFACSSENTGPIFSHVFASFRYEFFVSLRSEKNKTIFSLRKCSFRFIFCIHILIPKAVLWIRIFFIRLRLHAKNFDEALVAQNLELVYDTLFPFRLPDIALKIVDKGSLEFSVADSDPARRCINLLEPELQRENKTIYFPLKQSNIL
jgi:hypothetical protein